MDFETWTHSGVDGLRVKRLAIGYAVGALAVVSAGALIFLGSPNSASGREEEPELEVQLAREPEPEPEPPPPTPAVEEKPKPRPKLKVPVAIPKEAIKEAEPAPPQPSEPDPFEEPKATEIVEVAKPAVVEAPKPALEAPRPARPPGPSRVLENDTPPVSIGPKAKPELPAALRAAGVEGVVIVKYVVSETGVVTNAKVIKGPPELHEVCLAAVRSWRFKPALDFTGKAKAVTQLTRFAFKLKL